MGLPLYSESMTWPPLHYQTFTFGICRQQLENENHPAADNILLKVGKYKAKDTKYHEPQTEGKVGN